MEEDHAPLLLTQPLAEPQPDLDDLAQADSFIDDICGSFFADAGTNKHPVNNASATFAASGAACGTAFGAGSGTASGAGFRAAHGATAGAAVGAGAAIGATAGAAVEATAGAVGAASKAAVGAGAAAAAVGATAVAVGTACKVASGATYGVSVGAKAGGTTVATAGVAAGTVAVNDFQSAAVTTAVQASAIQMHIQPMEKQTYIPTILLDKPLPAVNGQLVCEVCPNSFRSMITMRQSVMPQFTASTNRVFPLPLREVAMATPQYSEPTMQNIREVAMATPQHSEPAIRDLREVDMATPQHSEQTIPDDGSSITNSPSSSRVASPRSHPTPSPPTANFLSLPSVANTVGRSVAPCLPTSVVPLSLSTSAASLERTATERKEWTTGEDRILFSVYKKYGRRWRRIAAELPGRSDDAVRNRWYRLKQDELITPCLANDRESHMKARNYSKGNAQKVIEKDRHGTERHTWSRSEDMMIIQNVKAIGHKWSLIAKQLPSRTEHAVRNRFHRLEAMMQDAQLQRLHATQKEVHELQTLLSSAPPVQKPTRVGTILPTIYSHPGSIVRGNSAVIDSLRVAR